MNALAVLRRLGVMVLGIAVYAAVVIAVQVPLHRAHVSNAVGAAVLIVLSLAVYAAFARFAERRAPRELALRPLVPELALGAATGFALFGATIALLAAGGAYAARSGTGWHGVVPVLLLTLAAALFEELLFRGFLFRTLRDLFGLWPAVAASGILFGAVHAFNPGASVTSTAAIALEAGVLLALAYAATDRLWLPLGIHAGWNFTESFVFGTAVSGHPVGRALVRGELHGPALLTGGVFGPEASLVAVAVCLLASAVLAACIARRSSRSQARRESRSNSGRSGLHAHVGRADDVLESVEQAERPQLTDGVCALHVSFTSGCNEGQSNGAP